MIEQEKTQEEPSIESALQSYQKEIQARLAAGNMFPEVRRKKVTKKTKTKKITGKKSRRKVDSMEKHLEKGRTEDNVNVFFCHNCPFATTLKKNMRKHSRVHIFNPKAIKSLDEISGKPLIEGYRVKFLGNCLVKERQKKEEPARVKRCHFCQFVDEEEKVDLHVTKVHLEVVRGMIQGGKVPFSCYHCGYTSSKFKVMKTHIEVHLGLKPMKTVKIIDGKRWYCCELCNVKTWRMGCYKRHFIETLKHGGERKFNCPHCDFKAYRFAQVKHHMKIHFERQGASCNVCGKVLKTPEALKIHKQYVHSSKTFSCDVCTYTASSASRIKSHVVHAHCEIRPFSCSQCAYKAKTKNILDFHMVTHSDERPFACDQCDKRFKRASVLKSHRIGLHSDEKPFECPHCDKRFITASVLQSHIRIHYNERPFKCSFCDHAAKFRTLIRYHEREVHFGLKPFKCSECSYSATRKQLIKIHMKKHHKSDEIETP